MSVNVSGSSSRDESADEIDDICGSIEKELADLQKLSNECSIYRVPKGLRQVDDKLYTPQVVSIGPLHHGKEELKAMEEHKRRYLHYFLQLSQGGVTLKQYVELIKGKETQLRNCYAETVHLNRKQFIKMMLIDAAFIILVLVRSALILRLMKTDDRVFTKPRKIRDVVGDILLLENQIPFFILDDLFKLSKISGYLERSFVFPERSVLREGVDLIKLAHLFLQGWIRPEISVRSSNSYRVEHLLQLLRTLLINPAGRHIERKEAKSLIIPSAVELRQAGVKFEPGGSDHNKDLFDIKFEDDGTLKIPPLIIMDSTEKLFQNLCAFEQCHCNTAPNFYERSHTISRNEECPCLLGLFGDYIAFMCQLVKGPNDAELLIRKGVIQNRALSNSEQVTNFFYRIDKGNVVAHSVFSYSNVIEDLNGFYADTWHKRKAALKQDYFKNPWTGISVFAAALLLALTIVQTVCSILQVKHQ